MSHKRYTIDEASDVIAESTHKKTEELLKSDKESDKKLQQMLQAQHELMTAALRSARQISAQKYERKREAVARVMAELKFFYRIEVQCRNALADLSQRNRKRAHEEEKTSRGSKKSKQPPPASPDSDTDDS